MYNNTCKKEHLQVTIRHDGERGNMEDMKEFVAYARKLLRVINKLEKYLEKGETDKALELVRELKEDTQKDIEA